MRIFPQIKMSQHHYVSLFLSLGNKSFLFSVFVHTSEKTKQNNTSLCHGNTHFVCFCFIKRMIG